MEKGKYNTFFINIIGSPCSCKSTVAANLFAELKKLGTEAELITEYAKDCVWENSIDTLEDQIFVFGNQFHRQKRIEGKVQYAINDSPFLLSSIYNKMDSAYLDKLIIEQYKKFNQKTYVLRRKTPYVNNGRVHTEAQSKIIDNMIIATLEKNNIPYEIVANTKAVHYILKQIKLENVKIA